MPPVPGRRAAIVFLLAVALSTCDAKLCRHLEIRNNSTELEDLRNCSVIVENLLLGLMPNIKRAELERYTFPELEEIWGYFMVINMKHLRSLGQMFPNLRVIRGLQTFYGRSMVLLHLDHLTEIRLPKLERIENGIVYINSCPKLCYWDTINWTKLGTELTPGDEGMRTNCPECPRECKDGCWNSETCQATFEAAPRRPERPPPDCRKQQKYHLYPSVDVCVTREECSDVRWHVFNDTICARLCPPQYELVGEDLCSWCGDSCERRCVSTYAVSNLGELKAYENCTHIIGNLTLRVDRPEVADELERYLGRVRIIEDILKVHRSPAIKSLKFFRRLETIGGRVLENNSSFIVLDNTNLEELWDWKDFKLTLRAGSILFHDNPKLCASEIKTFALKVGREHYTNMQVSPYSNGEQATCESISHDVAVYLTSPTSVVLRWTTVDNDEYFVYYKETSPSPEPEDACSDDWKIQATVQSKAEEVRAELTSLKPFTDYSFYLMTSTYNKTRTRRFRTLPDFPSEMLDVRTSRRTHDSLTIRWSPPTKRRGQLRHYLVTYFEVEDDESFIGQRDFCKTPRDTYILEEKAKVLMGNLTETTCRCPSPSKCAGLESLRPNDVVPTHCVREFIDELFDVAMTDVFAPKSVEDRPPDDRTFVLRIPAAETSVTIPDLLPFRLYAFSLSACNDNQTVEGQLCGEPVVLYNRTAKRPDADDIVDFDARLVDDVALLRWKRPANPNSLVLAYIVEYKQQSGKVVSVCLTKSGHEVRGLGHGTYRFRVRALSLAGFGRFSDYRTVVITNKTAMIVGVAGGFALLLSCVALYLYHRWKKKRELEGLHLIASVNPDYAGPVYVEDEWEVDRANVEIVTELGQGTFGMVYNGVIKPSKLPCAIKTIHAGSTPEDKAHFLNEANIMKSISDAHHVVRLLGVVSRGDPPLALMELMACGDLKTYLRRCRGSSCTITCNEMYRMAAEIADGMAYLSAKKFVHRDLAARNCMVSADKTCKVGDFGMTRDIYETDYYRKETKGLLPVRWMAPESLADGVFTSDSDVWSYGVVLWEMSTLAEQPYQGLANEQVFQFVIAHGTLDRPADCPDLLYEIMDVCWKWRPNSRPRFVDIVVKLERHVGEDFRVVSFTHGRQPQETERPYNPPALSYARCRIVWFGWKSRGYVLGHHYCIRAVQTL